MDATTDHAHRSALLLKSQSRHELHRAQVQHPAHVKLPARPVHQRVELPHPIVLHHQQPLRYAKAVDGSEPPPLFKMATILASKGRQRHIQNGDATNDITANTA